MKHDSGEYAVAAISNAQTFQILASSIDYDEQQVPAADPLGGGRRSVLAGCFLELLGRCLYTRRPAIVISSLLVCLPCSRNRTPGLERDQDWE